MKCLSNGFVVLILVMLIGCKSTQVVTERVLIKTDSCTVLELKEDIEFKENKILLLESEPNQTKNEIINESIYLHRHEIIYDTTSKIDAFTGKFPISSEIISENSTVVERKQSEYLNQLENTNIEMAEIVERLHNEKRSVETKTKRVFKLNWWLVGLGIGLLCFWFLEKYMC